MGPRTSISSPTDPSILLLDELSMGLAPTIVGWLYELAAAGGVSILAVEQSARVVLGSPTTRRPW